MLNIELARRNRKWTQDQLADMSRTAQWFISNLETGKSYPTPEQRDRLARILDIPAELLMETVPLGREEQAPKAEVA
jgi:transcriptional regulator with XRE-family HTH domain